MILEKVKNKIGQGLVPRFFNWWGAEIIAVVPFLGRLFSSELITGSVAHGEICFNFSDNDTVEEELFCIAEDGQLDAAVIKNILRKKPHVICFSEDQALIKKVVFPLAAKENLREVIQYEIDRFVPFSLSEIYFDFEVVGVNSENVICQLVVVERKKIEAVTNFYTTNKLDLVKISVLGDFVTDNINLLPDAERSKKSPVLSLINCGLIAAAVFLLLGLGNIIIEHKKSQLTEIKSQLDYQKKEAKLAIDLKNRIEKLKAKSVFPAKHYKEKNRVSRIISSLAEILPRDTWLTQIEINDTEIKLSGESKNASPLIELLELSPIFSNPKFNSSLIKNELNGYERFSMKVNVDIDDLNKESIDAN